MKRGIIMLLTACLLCALAMTAGAEEVYIDGNAFMDAVRGTLLGMANMHKEQGYTYVSLETNANESIWYTKRTDTMVPDIYCRVVHDGDSRDLLSNDSGSAAQYLALERRMLHWQMGGNEGVPYDEEKVAAFNEAAGAPQDAAVCVTPICENYSVGMMIFGLQTTDGETVYGGDSWIADELYLLVNMRINYSGDTEKTIEDLFLIADQDVVAEVVRGMEYAGDAADSLTAWVKRRLGDDVQPPMAEGNADTLMRAYASDVQNIGYVTLDYRNAMFDTDEQAGITRVLVLSPDDVGTLYRSWKMEVYADEEMAARTQETAAGEYETALGVMEREGVTNAAQAGDAQMTFVAGASTGSGAVNFLAALDAQGEPMGDELYLLLCADRSDVTLRFDEKFNMRESVSDCSDALFIADQAIVQAAAELAIDYGFITETDEAVFGWLERRGGDTAQDDPALFVSPIVESDGEAGESEPSGETAQDGGEGEQVDLDAISAFFEQVHDMRPAFDWDGAAFNYERVDVDGETVGIGVWLDESDSAQTVARPWAMRWEMNGWSERTAGFCQTQYMTGLRVMNDFGMSAVSPESAGRMGIDVAKLTAFSLGGLYNGNNELQVFFYLDSDSQRSPGEIFAIYSYDVYRTNDDGSTDYARMMETIVDQGVVREIAQLMLDIGIFEEDEAALLKTMMEISATAEQARTDASAAVVQFGTAQRMVRITGNGNVNVRAKSNADSAKVGTAKEGNTYPCVSVAKNGWYEIALEDGTTGFVSPKLAEMVE